MDQGLAFESVIGNVLRGWTVAKGADGACTTSAPGAVRLIWLRHLGRDGVIAEPEEDSDIWRDDAPDRLQLQAGDILLSEVVTGRPKAAIVQESDLPAVAVGSILVLRPALPLSPEHARLLLAFLRSDTVGDLAVGTLQKHIRPKDLATLQPPADDEALSAALDELDVARRRMSEWSADAATLADTVFDRGTSLVEARRSIIAAGRLTRLRAEAAAALDDPDYIVRTRLPYPVALRWREVEARMSAGDRRPAYDAVIDAAEVLLAYSALVTAALACEAGIELASVTAVQRKLSATSGGPGFGEWASILTEIRGKKRRGVRPDHPLHELGAFFDDDATDRARIRLADRRNDKSHGRAPTDVMLPAVLDEAHADLRCLLASARFLADLTLIHVMAVVWDDFQGAETIRFRGLMGDHPVVPTSAMQHTGDRVETGSLYLADRDHRLYRLRPFLTCEVCETCHSWSTFHADKVKGTLVQKSLEHGHYYPYRGNEQVLRAARLL
ncbi:MAG: hypothetical protein JWO67_4086 [Streptosporangiaceae bacterium]|nr:hypothetical protein [Streptosporangiaceae bacterium]